MSAQTNFNKAQQAKMAAINLPHPYNYNNSQVNTNVTIGPAYTNPNGGLVISNGTSGTLGTNTYGGLTWNGNPLGGFDKPTVSRISEMMKDGLSREIVLCESREDCKEKYGSYGVKLFDSMLNEVLQEAIKSEEAFNLLLQTEHEKTSKLKEFIVTHMGMTDEARHLFISLMLS